MPIVVGTGLLADCYTFLLDDVTVISIFQIFLFCEILSGKLQCLFLNL